MDWVPSYPPTRGMHIAVTDPSENQENGVVWYRIMCHFDEGTSFDAPLEKCPIPEQTVLSRITVACNDVLVLRRFSEFDAAFKKIGSQASLPPLPQKKLFGAKDAKFIEERRAAIEQYIRAVLCHPNVSLYRTPEFLHLIGFANLQLWFALSGPDTEEPSTQLLHTVLTAESEVLRIDAVQKAATTKTEAVRRSIGRLVHYSMKYPESAAAFTCEDTRFMLTAIAKRTEHDSTRYWIATAVKDLAQGSENARQIVGRGDVRDALVNLAMAATSQACLGACVEAISAAFTGGSQGVRQLYATSAVCRLLASIIRKADDVRVLQCSLQLVVELASHSHHLQATSGTFRDSELEAALRLARDMLASGSVELRSLLDEAFRATGCDPTTTTVAATRIPCRSELPSWSLTDAHPTHAKQQQLLATNAIDDFLHDDSADEATAVGDPAKNPLADSDHRVIDGGDALGDFLADEE